MGKSRLDLFHVRGRRTPQVGITMLQISTGKFFDTDATFDTTHRGVLYSNFQTLGGDTISTQAGNLLAATRWGDIETFVCEVFERQPKLIAPGVVGSVGPDSFIHDFAAVCSFSLERLLTPDRDLATRLLTAQRPPLGIPKLPKQYVSMVFDTSLPYDAQAPARLESFIAALLRLERKSFTGVMKAIRRYVTAMHRLADDLDLAYALFVAAIESLAQEFDNFSPEWEDYDQTKRKPVDTALRKASPETAAAVRDAILSSEHVAIGRRFREFTVSHLGTGFFRDGAARRAGPTGKSDLMVALRNAYNVRSGYVHTLKAIPRLLASPMALTDIIQIDGSPYLTFEGLARVVRTVILEYVSRAPTAERESVAYWDDFPNMLRAPLAPSMWIHNAEQYSHHVSYMYLNGFLQQVEQNLLNPSEPLTDIRAVARRIESLLPTLAKREQRRPLTTLHFWFSYFLPVDERDRSRERIEKFISELDTECAEAFFLYVFLNSLPKWSAESCEAIFETYIRKRYEKQRLNVGKILGAAGALTVAEMYRVSGNEVAARRLIARAVEEFPAIAQLRKYEASLKPSLEPIVWQQILLPSASSSSSVSNTSVKRLTKLNRRIPKNKRVRRIGQRT